MTLDSKGWVYWWAYLLTEWYNKPIPGAQTNLCKVFWRCVFWTPAKLTLIGAGTAFAGFGLFYIPFKDFGWLGLLITPGVLGGLAGLGWALSKGFQSETLAEVHRAIKERYCPIVKVE